LTFDFFYAIIFKDALAKNIYRGLLFRNNRLLVRDSAADIRSE